MGCESMSTATDFIDYVPKSLEENLEWRVRMGEAAIRDVRIQRALYDAAMDDILFFFNAFLFVLEPRGENPVLPFVSWPHQDPVLKTMDETISRAITAFKPMALTCVKSRAQGGTYGYLGVFIRRFLRDRMFSAGLVTRNEKLVDSMTDQDTILHKVAWSLDQLPFWMLPQGYQRSLTDHTILNPENGSSFTGYAATGDCGRGGRRTVFALDEFGSDEFVTGGKDARVMSSVSSVSNCIFLVSTFGSDVGVFAEEATDPDNPLLVKLDWKDNPTQTKNAYVMRNGKLEAVNRLEQADVDEYAQTHALQLRKIERRGHKMEGKFRSPWYDQFCLMPGHTPRFVARELDMNPRGAAGKLFLTEVLDEMKRKNAKPPVWEGRPAVIDRELHLLEQEGGPLKLWFKPGLSNEPPKGVYAVGCDIATGVAGDGGSNSCLIGGNASTREQVLEYTDPNISPIRLARLSDAICRWLHEAILIWEVMGPTGKGFGTEIMHGLGYWNVWTRVKEDKITKERTRIPGWVNNSPGAKLDLFDLFCVAMDEDEFIPRSDDMLRECGGWESDGSQIIYKGTGHGDRAIAGGLCCKAMNELRETAIDKNDGAGEHSSQWSMAGRLQKRQEEENREEESDFAGFSNKAFGGW